MVIFKDDWTSNSDTSFGPTRAQPIRLDISSVQVSILLQYYMHLCFLNSVCIGLKSHGI